MDFKDKLVVITGGAQGFVSKAEWYFEILMLRQNSLMILEKFVGLLRRGWARHIIEREEKPVLWIPQIKTDIGNIVPLRFNCTTSARLKIWRTTPEKSHHIGKKCLTNIPRTWCKKRKWHTEQRRRRWMPSVSGGKTILRTWLRWLHTNAVHVINGTSAIIIQRNTKNHIRVFWLPVENFCRFSSANW